MDIFIYILLLIGVDFFVAYFFASRLYRKLAHVRSKHKKTKSVLTFIAIFIVVLVVVGGLVFYYSQY